MLSVVCPPATEDTRADLALTRTARLSLMPFVPQQRRNLSRPLRRQTPQYIFDMDIRLVPVVASRLDQTHDRSGALPSGPPNRSIANERSAPAALLLTLILQRTVRTPSFD